MNKCLLLCALLNARITVFGGFKLDGGCSVESFPYHLDLEFFLNCFYIRLDINIFGIAGTMALPIAVLECLDSVLICLLLNLTKSRLETF